MISDGHSRLETRETIICSDNDSIIRRYTYRIARMRIISGIIGIKEIFVVLCKLLTIEHEKIPPITCKPEITLTILCHIPCNSGELVILVIENSHSLSVPLYDGPAS